MLSFMHMTKKCNVCYIEKQVSEFYDSKRTRDRKESKCKVCHLEYNSTWQKYNPYKCRAKTARYRSKKKARQSNPS
jgi:hypothetical protein